MSFYEKDMLRNRNQRKNTRTPDCNFIPVAQARAYEAELDQLVDHLSTSDGFKGEYLGIQYKSKYCDNSVNSPIHRKRATIVKWQKTELTNCTTNQRIQLGEVDFGWTTSDRFQTKVRQLISTVLGPLDYPGILFQGSGHTNGASTRVNRSSIAAIEKHTGEAHVSSTCLKHWFSYACGSKLAEQVNLKIQESSVLFTVPKSTDIDRAACKEPEINMLLQRSVGTHIRRRLRKTPEGINLNDQSINKDLARSAVQNGLATIDLSAASDSITRQLVIELLPTEWWSLLDDLRVHSTLVDDEVHELEMFSSMGNGFTFELESLIFWAIAKATKYLSGKKGKLSVYGDDIIVPSTIAPRLARIFSYYGFRVNPDKSFWTGDFRESCGGHYHRNLDVTPFFLKEPIRYKTDIIRTLNQLLEWSGRGWGFFTNPLAAVFHRKWSKIIPQSLHGGQDPMDPSALVTGTPPRMRLVPKMKKIKYPHQEALVCWFTKRETMGIIPLSFDVRKHVYFVMKSQSYWTVRTSWTPYVILE